MLPVTLRAFLRSYDEKTKRAQFLFLDEAKENNFTVEYIQAHSISINKRGEFCAKCVFKTCCYARGSNEIRVPIQHLIDKAVELVVTPRRYSFVTPDKKKLQGTALTIQKMVALTD
jgi:hypothetical protein